MSATPIRAYGLSVHEYGEKLREELGHASEALVKEYAVARTKWKGSKKNKDLKYNIDVLSRMRSRGCSACEIKRQERHIKGLRESQCPAAVKEI